MDEQLIFFICFYLAVFVWLYESPHFKLSFLILLKINIHLFNLQIIALFFANLLFLGHAFTIMLVYIWSRRNPQTRITFFGLLTFQAPYLPWVLFGFSLLLRTDTMVDLMGISVGHLYYFLEDVAPGLSGFRFLKTQKLM